MRPLAILVAIAVLQLVRALPPTGDQFFALFGAYLESLRTQAAIPGLSAAIVGEDDILWERAFGQQDLERSIAARTDTPGHLNGLTQVFTATLVLRCADEGRLSLDDRVGQFDSDSPDANSTIRQVLTHTSGAPDNLFFSYRPQRLDSLKGIVRVCTGDSFRETVANLLERFAMVDSVPGEDAIRLVPPAEGIPDAAAVERYTGALARLAVPYSVDGRGRSSPSQYAATTLTPSNGLISTVRDFARFDVALRKGAVVRADTLAAAWRPGAGRDGLPLPHGMGWFVQSYNGEPVVWQYGVNRNASSSLVVTLPGRGLTFVLMANSDSIARPFVAGSSDVTTSPFGRLFLGLVVR